MTSKRGCFHFGVSAVSPQVNSRSAHLVSFDRQVEFSYPPLMPDEGHDSNVLPEEWRYLPFLALPDGAHNYQEGRKSLNLHFLAAKTTIRTGKNRTMKERNVIFGVNAAGLGRWRSGWSCDGSVVLHPEPLGRRFEADFLTFAPAASGAVALKGDTLH